MSEQSIIILNKLFEQVDSGQFDNEITLPFMSRELVKSSLKSRMDKKVETGSTPLLSKSEVEEAVQDAKEIAVSTAAIFLEVGILENTEVGIMFSEKWGKHIEII